MRAFSAVLLLTCACGAAGSPPSDASSAEPRPAPDPVVHASAAAPPSDPPEEAEADDGAAAPVGTPETSPAPKPSRNILYRVTSEGLVIEADGVRFKPAAEAVRLSNGGYSVRLRISAEVTDTRNHTLLTASHGAIAMAATIFDKNGKQVGHHGDTREPGSTEDELLVLTPGSTEVLERTWPSGSVKGPLWWGQKVTLWVGLWGLGTEEAAPRSVKKLFKVDMVAGAHARPVITPPDT